jgi:thiamine biosynthesis lipoprotein
MIEPHPHHAFHFEAMATAFTVIIAQENVDATYASQASNAVRLEVERLEEELSRFKPTSEIWRLGQLQAGQRTRLSMAAWDCLSLAKALHQETLGALDITIGPLMRLWRQHDGSPRTPHPSELEEARRITGSHLFELHEEDLSITLHASPMVFDLGAIGKGYALDQAVNILQDWSIQNALLNAGDSTVLALGSPDGTDEGWIIRLDEDHLQPVTLKNRALSGTGFGVQGEHIMDPRTLQPVPARPGHCYALAPTAALADALSTAFMVMTHDDAQSLCARYPQVERLVPSSPG